MPSGVYPRTTDPTKPCGACKRPKDDHTPNCPRGKAKGDLGKKSKPVPGKTRRAKKARTDYARQPQPSAPTNGADPIVTIRSALEQLEAELANIRALKAAMAKALNA